jgi:hypothetical protein
VSPSRAAWVAAAGTTLAACSLLLNFDPNGQPCDSRGGCLPGYQCVAGKCQPGTCTTCGDSGAPGDGGTDAGCVGLQCQVPVCDAGQSTSIFGTVLDPSGLVPVPSATVYVPAGQVQPFPTHTTCLPCSTWITGQPMATAVTDPSGAFRLSGAPAGASIPLVVQRGRWRRQVTLAVPACQAADAGAINLPRTQAEGDIPRMAIVTGIGDPMECALLHFGVAAQEFTHPDGGGRIHLYAGNGNILVGSNPSAAELFDAGLDPYDLVLLPCQAAPATQPPGQVQALAAYLDTGGRAVTSHYGESWLAPGYPSAAGWRGDSGTLPLNPIAVSVNRGFPQGQIFASWLGADSGVISVFNPRVDVGTVNAPTVPWFFGDDTGLTAGTNYNWTPYLTFDTPLDAGTAPECGRAGFFDFHVSVPPVDAGVFPANCPAGPLAPNEKAALFFLLDLGDCPSP